MKTGSGGLTSAIPLIAKGRNETDAVEATPVDMNYFLGIDTATNRLAVDFKDATDGTNFPFISSGTAITSNVWHHAAATFDGTRWRVYLDGVLDGTSGTTTLVPESTSTQHASLATAMNSSGVPVGAFQGVLDEARIGKRRPNHSSDHRGLSAGIPPAPPAFSVGTR